MNKQKCSVWIWGGVIVMLCLLPGAHATTAQGQAMLTLTPLEVGVAETGVIEGRIDCGTTGCGGFKVALSFDRSLLRAEAVAVGPYLGDQVFWPTTPSTMPPGRCAWSRQRWPRRPRARIMCCSG